MKSLIIIIIIILFNSQCIADPAAPIIRSFVEIELKDGSIIQGAIQIAYPEGYFGSYRRNGIYYIVDKYEGIIYFDIDLKVIEISEKRRNLSAIYENPKSQPTSTPNIGVPSVKYLQCIYTNPQFDETFIVTNKSLSRKQIRFQNYLLLDYIPLETKVGYTTDTNSIEKIELDQIEKIKMLKSPPKNMIDQLKLHREKIKADRANNESGDGYNDPIWYHELIKDDKLYQEFLLIPKN